MLKVLALLCITYSNGNEQENQFAQYFNFGTERTSTPGTVSPVAQFYTSDSSNFTELTKSDFFVDKTLLIKDLLDGKVSAFLEISAAPHFGKSTNLDMIKRFLEMNVDDRGRRVRSDMSANYKAFTNKHLEITKYKEVFDEHFGKYPVISIDYKPLETVTKFDFLLKKYRQVLFETFTHHRYLQHVEELWKNQTNCEADFLQYSTEGSNINLNQSEIEEGFIKLAGLLYAHFKTPVVVLIGDYDIIVDAPVSEDCREAVYGFIVNMNNRIIESKFVSRVLLTGSLLRGGIPYSPKVKSALETYPKLLRHYGLSMNELNSLLKRFIRNNTEIEDAIQCIVKNYSGYVRSFDVYDEMEFNPRNDIVCSVWSVVQYLTCVRKINVANLGETDALSITYMCIRDRARLIKTF